MFSFIGQIFNLFIAQPIFNLLIIILAFLPGHNFGVAIIIFTILVRFAMYPLLRKQLHHAMAMRKLQPEIRKIKKETKGDRQKESQMLMALYKEKEVSPFGSIGIILVQLPILIALYTVINKIVTSPDTLFTFTYSFVQNLNFMEQLKAGAVVFDETLLGFIDLTRSALGDGGVIYWPAMILVVLSVIVQYFQSKQLMVIDKKTRTLRQIFKDSAAGKEVDQMEIQQATSRLTLILIPFMIFVFTIYFPAALALYWLVSGLVAFGQQTYILRQDVEEMEEIADKLDEKEAKAVNKAKKANKKTSTAKRKKTKRRR
jgi:YidC/Oxa1 family membrane protein insertase